MARFAAKLLAATAALPLAAAVLLTPATAHADWHRGYGGYSHGYGYGGYGYRRGPGIIGGALLGLGVGALLAAPYVAPPRVVYAPPPAYYPPPGYGYAPPAYYAPAPAPYYYGQ